MLGIALAAPWVACGGTTRGDAANGLAGGAGSGGGTVTGGTTAAGAGGQGGVSGGQGGSLGGTSGGSNGGAGGFVDCRSGTCGVGAFCGRVSWNGYLELLGCQAYSTSCETCGCAIAALRVAFTSSYPGQGLPPCICSDGAGHSIADGGVSATLFVACDGA